MHHQVDRCLVVPDIHQDLAWVVRILAKEAAEGTDLIVFLGDYFDSRRDESAHSSVAETCAWLDKASRLLGKTAIFLLGNHDVQYLEAMRACDSRRTSRSLGTKCGAAFSQQAAKTIATTLPPEFWSSARLFACVNGHLLSHAGLHRSFWPTAPTLDDSLAKLDADCRKALADLAPGRPVHPLLEAGRVRGGDAPVGGLTWLDWDDEFEDALPLPQIVGHTASFRGARQNGRSWCLDGVQICYGILTRDGVEVRVA